MDKETLMDGAGTTTNEVADNVIGLTKHAWARPNNPRTIETRYFAYGSRCRPEDTLRTVRSRYPDIAVRNAQWRMSQGYLGAGVCEVWDLETAKHFATITCYGAYGSMNVEYLKYPVREGSLLTKKQKAQR
jgi:hypothetical protein